MVLNLDKCIVAIPLRDMQERMDLARWRGVCVVQHVEPNRVSLSKEWQNQKSGEAAGPATRAEASSASGRQAEGTREPVRDPNLPAIDDYYEPFTFDYEHLQKARLSETAADRGPVSSSRAEDGKIEWGRTGRRPRREFASRGRDALFGTCERDVRDLENTFMMYLPRLCEHCLNPACVASCPSGSVYKREDDGIVLVDQDKCRGWRMCISGCPYKKIYSTGRAARRRSASSVIRALKPVSRP